MFTKKNIIIAVVAILAVCCLCILVIAAASKSGSTSTPTTQAATSAPVTKTAPTQPAEASPTVAAVPPTETQPAADATEAPGKIGDTSFSNGLEFTLNSGTIKDGVVHVNFTIINKDPKAIDISTLIEFSAKAEDGTKLKQQLLNCGPQVDGKLLPGDKVRGDICWSGLTSPTVMIYYMPYLGAQYDYAFWKLP